jgi:hypothetical protein
MSAAWRRCQAWLDPVGSGAEQAISVRSMTSITSYSGGGECGEGGRGNAGGCHWDGFVDEIVRYRPDATAGSEDRKFEV